MGKSLTFDMDVRTFISVPVPATPELESLVSGLKGLRNVRASPLEQMHATLGFIGDIDERRLDDVCGCVRRACAGISGFNVDIAGVSGFPNTLCPRVIWVGARSGGNLEALAGRIATELDAAGIPRDTKPFKPHITVGRVSGSTDMAAFQEANGRKVFATFRCGDVKVMRSVLSQYGARHYVVESVALG